MDIFYWAVIGLLVAFGAKVQLPTQDDESMLWLLAAGVLGAIVSGLFLRAFFHTGMLSMSWVSHLAAFIGAAVLVLGLRVANRQHLA